MTEPRGLHAVATADPGRVAIIDGDRRITYGELERLVNRIANTYAKAGVGHGDAVALVLHNSAEFFAASNAVARLGAFMVPVSWRLTAPELAHILRDSGAKVAVYDDPARVRHALDGLPDLRASYHVEDPALADPDDSPPTEEFLGATVTTMNYTSGTTGRPKGIERALPVPMREAPPPEADLAALTMRFFGFGAGDVHLLTGPAYHTAPGVWAQMHLVEGAPVVVLRQWDADECLRLIERERVTNSHMVPANFVRILEVDWRSYDRSSVRKVIHGAAPCPPAVKRRVMEVFDGAEIWEYYGMSEGMGSFISPQEWLERPGSVGKAFPGISFAIRDEEGRELPPGEVGLVYVSAPGDYTFRYRNAEDKTAEAWRDRFFTVGDYGWLDADGYLYIADRRTDLVITNGINVYPAEVEQALAEHPDVVDSAVIGLPDDRSGQRVHAIVEVRPGAPRDGEGIVEFLRSRLADFKLPRTVEFVDELPREPNGKVVKHRLRDERMAPARTER